MLVNDIIAEAQQATGLSDLGDPSVLEGLEKLVTASNEEARLSAAGAPRWEATIVSTLANRLRIVDHLKRHPIGQMRKLYAHFGEQLTPRAQAAMVELLARNPQGKHGKHHYSLEEFGLTAAGVRKHFRDYYERYGISPRESAN
jgi:hypothetical protein